MSLGERNKPCPPSAVAAVSKDTRVRVDGCSKIIATDLPLNNCGTALTLRAGVDNVLDKDYRHHLGGYNRVKNSEIDVMQRLPSEGVSAWAEISYNF